MAASPDPIRGAQVLQDFVNAGYNQMSLTDLTAYYNNQNPAIIPEIGAVADDANLTPASYQAVLTGLIPGYFASLFGTPSPPSLDQWTSAFAAGESSLTTVIPQAAAATVSQVAAVGAAGLGVYLAYLAIAGGGLFVLSKFFNDSGEAKQSPAVKNPRRRRRRKNPEKAYRFLVIKDYY